ncbi:hypothetical protein Tco_0864090 [Tanacetum coccineum]
MLFPTQPWKRIFKKRSKKKAKNKQIQAREGKDQIKSKSKVIRILETDIQEKEQKESQKQTNPSTGRKGPDQVEV